ncbi:unnamed protein product [Cyprideis torosa]|uniref:Uncharacterized protein n=1 Tax=Cyprideis torosa TaxID=163714 RepID=A0A7R8WIG7_9CRUS|nr:unnamed protein product [Cyprideis torosa]CAG0900740.1 unnamed protein product [Cyprideis torosa]
MFGGFPAVIGGSTSLATSYCNKSTSLNKAMSSFPTSTTNDEILAPPYDEELPESTPCWQPTPVRRGGKRWTFAASKIQMDVRSPLETREGTLQKCLAAFLPYCHFHVLQPPERVNVIPPPIQSFLFCSAKSSHPRDIPVLIVNDTFTCGSATTSAVRVSTGQGNDGTDYKPSTEQTRTSLMDNV